MSGTPSNRAMRAASAAMRRRRSAAMAGRRRGEIFIARDLLRIGREEPVAVGQIGQLVREPGGAVGEDAVGIEQGETVGRRLDEPGRPGHPRGRRTGPVARAAHGRAGVRTGLSRDCASTRRTIRGFTFKPHDRRPDSSRSGQARARSGETLPQRAGGRGAGGARRGLRGRGRAPPVPGRPLRPALTGRTAPRAGRRSRVFGRPHLRASEGRRLVVVRTKGTRPRTRSAEDGDDGGPHQPQRILQNPAALWGGGVFCLRRAGRAPEVSGQPFPPHRVPARASPGPLPGGGRAPGSGSRTRRLPSDLIGAPPARRPG